MAHPNKVILTSEQESFIRNNYKTMNGFQLSAGTGLTHRIIKRRMAELSLVRTDAEKRAVWEKRRMPEPKEISKRNRKIEGGGRGKLKAKWHLDKWNAKNGSFSNKHMLVYKNGKFDDYNDLKLIRKWRYDLFVEERKERLKKAEERAANKKVKDAIKDEKKQKRDIVLAALASKKEEKEKVEKAKRAETAKRMAISAKKANATKKNKEEAEARAKKLEEIKKNSKPLNQTHKTMMQEEKVRVKIDHRTTIFVKKSLCEQLENGTWVKIK